MSQAFRPSLLQESSRNAANALYFPNLIQIYHFSFQTLDEASQLAGFIASVCPEECQKKLELGVNEIFVNAIEHGNLGIDCKLKSHLKKTNQWENEILARLEKWDNQTKCVDVIFEINPSYLLLTVKDQGGGFDWQGFFSANEPLASKHHGRGIIMAKEFCFDSIEYSSKGNEVRCLLVLN